MKILYFFALLISISFNADALWWGKKKTEIPLNSTAQPAVTARTVDPSSAKKALASGFTKPATPGLQTTTPSYRPETLKYNPQPSRLGTPSSTPGPGHKAPLAGSEFPKYNPQPSRLGTPSSTPGPGHKAPLSESEFPKYNPQPLSPGTPVPTPGSALPGHQRPSSGSNLQLSTPRSIETSSNRSPSPTGEKTSDRLSIGGIKPGSPNPTPKQGVPSFGVTQPERSQPTSQPGKGLSIGTTVRATAVTTISPKAGETEQKYSSNPTFSKGKYFDNEDLVKLSEALFIKDKNNAMKHITLNLQQKQSASSSVDNAPQPLLIVEQDALNISTIERVLSIYNNYNSDSRINEYINPAQRQEENLVLDTFLETTVMSFAAKVLAEKEQVKTEKSEFRKLLKQIWFSLYSLGLGIIGSSGFEHVFMSEIQGNEILGFNNWIYFNDQELKKHVDYLGYVNKVDLGKKAAILKFNLKYKNLFKRESTMFIGTSPELEMALYTVCFLVRPNQACPVSLGGTKFNIITEKIKYRGVESMKSAYPEI